MFSYYVCSAVCMFQFVYVQCVTVGVGHCACRPSFVFHRLITGCVLRWHGRFVLCDVGHSVCLMSVTLRVVSVS